MSGKFFMALCLGLSVLSVPFASADVESRLVDVKIQNLFVPYGYDDNDEVVVILDGYLPDTCFKLATTEVTQDAGKIIITQKAREYSGNCFDVTVPFTTTVKLGVLAKGDYAVSVNRGTLSEQLGVKEATKAGPDDYLYAPVEAARVEGGSAVLQGRFTNNCLKLDSVKLSHTGKTVQVLPIMSLLTATQAGHACETGEFNFSHSVRLQDLKLDSGRHLLHVRSLDGQSVNTVFSSHP